MTCMPWPQTLLLVALGGAVGAVLRHLLALAPLGPGRGLLMVNVGGSAALGLLVGLGDQVPPWALLLLGTGLCGALTTWSLLAARTADLARTAPASATAYLLLTLALGLGAAAGGLWLGSSL